MCLINNKGPNNRALKKQDEIYKGDERGWHCMIEENLE